MRILVINRDSLDKIPPLISVIKILKDLDHNISVITCDLPQTLHEHFKDNGIKTTIVPYRVEKNIWKKIKNVILYRKKAYKVVDTFKPELIWIEGGGTFRVLVDIAKRYEGNFVLQISELYQKNRKIHSALRKLIPSAAALVMPEYNRAVLFQIKYDLPMRPFVLPNKPYFWLTEDLICSLKMKYKDVLNIFIEKKVILYQGILHKERDLTNYIKAISKLKNEYQIVLLGPDWGMLGYYKSIDSSIIHIDFIPAPDYLIFTMNAYIGVVTYDDKDLNCAYCAPNKLYEYAKYGLPMIGNDIPGLKYTINMYHAGIIIETQNEKSILDAIKKINQRYEYYSDGSKCLFNETDNVLTIEKIIERASKK